MAENKETELMRLACEIMGIIPENLDELTAIGARQYKRALKALAEANTQGEKKGRREVLESKAVRDIITKVLNEHTLSDWEGSDGEAVNLVDHLSAGATIEGGQKEISLIVESIFDALEAFTKLKDELK